MSDLDVFAWVVLIVILVAALVVWFVLAMLPGRIARQRGHPQADAISICGWLGALAFGIFWPVAMVWAFTAPVARVPDDPDVDKRLAALEGVIAALAAGKR